MSTALKAAIPMIHIKPGFTLQAGLQLEAKGHELHAFFGL